MLILLGVYEKSFSVPLSLHSPPSSSASLMGRIWVSLTIPFLSSQFCLCLYVLFLFFFFLLSDLDLKTLFSRSSYKSESLNSPDLTINLGSILPESKYKNLINIFSWIRYLYVLSIYRSFVSGSMLIIEVLAFYWITKICSYKCS